MKSENSKAFTVVLNDSQFAHSTEREKIFFAPKVFTDEKVATWIKQEERDSLYDPTLLNLQQIELLSKTQQRKSDLLKSVLHLLNDSNIDKKDVYIIVAIKEEGHSATMSLELLTIYGTKITGYESIYRIGSLTSKDIDSFLQKIISQRTDGQYALQKFRSHWVPANQTIALYEGYIIPKIIHAGNVKEVEDNIRRLQGRASTLKPGEHSYLQKVEKMLAEYKKAA
jgi:hypothetical protein